MVTKKKMISFVLSISFVLGLCKFNVNAETPGIAEEFVPGVVLAAISGGIEPLSITADNVNDIYDGLSVVSVDTLVEADNSGGLESSETYEIVMITLENKEPQAVLDAVETLKANPKVLSAQPDYIGHIEETIPSDDFFELLDGIKNIDAPIAWDKFTGSKDVVVGVMDTGIDINHPDLKDNIWINPNEGKVVYNYGGKKYTCRNDKNGWDFYNHTANVMDDDYHGTCVAGIIGATGNNEYGVAGVNWNVSLASLKICNSQDEFTNSRMITALEYARKNNINIINCSLGWYDDNEDTTSPIYLEIKKFPGLLICSAGNDNYNNDEVHHYPSNYNLNNVISVGEISTSNNAKGNYGKNTVHLGAPGEGILCCFPNDYEPKNAFSPVVEIGSDGGKYGRDSGSSFAAPHVTGAAALLMGYRPDLTIDEIKQTILNSVDKLPQLESKYITGGKLNVNSMLELAGEGEISLTIPEIFYSGGFDIDSFDIWSDGSYRNRNVYCIISRYNVSDDILGKVSSSIYMNELGEGTYTNFNTDIKLRSASEYLKIELYNDENCQNLILRSFIKPLLFSF